MFKKIDLQMPNSVFRDNVRQVISELPGKAVSEADTETLIKVVVFLTEFLVLCPQEPPLEKSNKEKLRINYIHKYQLICQVLDGLYGSGWNRETVLFILGTILTNWPETSAEILRCYSGSWRHDGDVETILLVREYLLRSVSHLGKLDDHSSSDLDRIGSKKGFVHSGLQHVGRNRSPSPDGFKVYEIGKITGMETTVETPSGQIPRKDLGPAVIADVVYQSRECEFAGETADYFFNIPNVNVIKNKYEYWYLNLLRRLIKSGGKEDRTGTGTHSDSFETYRHDLREGFPALRSRFLKPENPGKELVWMLSGSDNEKDLAAMGVPFWSEFADETGNLGPVYGYLWRHWPNGDGTETDQVKYIQDLLKTNPTSRRMVVDCWHPSFIPNSKTPPKDNYKEGKQALTPCHILWDVVVQPMVIKDRWDWLNKNVPDNFDVPEYMNRVDDGKNLTEKLDWLNVPKYFLDLGFVMRSTDTVLGLPANMNFYATLAHALAAENNMVPRYLGYVGMDVHVYKNHLEGIEKQFQYVRENTATVFNEVTEFRIEGGVKDILDMDPEQFRYDNYSRELVGPAIKFPIAV